MYWLQLITVIHKSLQQKLIAAKCFLKSINAILATLVFFVVVLQFAYYNLLQLIASDFRTENGSLISKYIMYYFIFEYFHSIWCINY